MPALTVKLTKKAIEIKLPLSILAKCVEGAPDLREYGVQVVDAVEFAKDVLYELEREDSAGANMVHKMFDEAFLEAFEQGSLGVLSNEDAE